MNKILEMLFQQKIQQIPQSMMKQLENQLKMMNPQAFKEYQQARKDNNPQEYLNKVIDGFSPEQKQQWNNMMKTFSK
jgi:hypothetical protein